METSVPGWFAGRSVLVTGATGFMGKVLVEKLLRSCPKIGAVYILVRSKRGKNPTQRLGEFLESPVFDKLRNSPNSSEIFEKIRLISGDITQPNVNLSSADVRTLQKNLTVIFHVAANVRFDQPLKTVLAMNTGGTLNVLKLAETLPELIAFVHVSTAYCHCDQTELEEIPYKAPHPPQKLLEFASWADEELLQTITPTLLQRNPNTYSYTKCLTEQLVTEFAEKIPIAIARPSIVTASWKEPLPGWVDNLNGPTGLIVGAGKGVIRSMHCKADYDADLMPVDIAINTIILTAWHLGTLPKSKDPLVVNVCKADDNMITWGDAIEIGKIHVYKNPFSMTLWYPSGSIKSSYALHYISVILFHLMPAYFIDFILTIMRKKPFLVQIQKRIQSGLQVLQYYTTRKWKFHNENMKKISSLLDKTDKEMFYTNIKDINWNSYILAYVLGARKYCVHEEPSTIPAAKILLRRLYIMQCIKNVIFLGLALWFFWQYATSVLNAMDSVLKSTANLIPTRF